MIQINIVKLKIRKQNSYGAYVILELNIMNDIFK